MNRQAHSLGLLEADESLLFRAPDWRWSSQGRIGWWVRPQWQSSLIGDQGLRLDEWQQQGLLTVVKTGPHRSVYRVDLPQGPVYVKHYKVPSWREVLRQWFRRGKGRNEGKRAVSLARIGVPTITPIALGEERIHKFLFENYLITPEIPGTLPLDTFLEQKLGEYPREMQGTLRRDLARKLAELTALLHDRGFLHQDFHPGNLLVGVDSEGSISLAMIDLDALRLRKQIGPRATVENLALLNHYFWLRCDRSDRHRFLAAYLQARYGHTRELRRFAAEVEVKTRSWAERLWRRWGRRCRGTNKYFKVFRGRGLYAVASRELDREQVRRFMADPDAPFADLRTRLIKSSTTTTVAELPLQMGERERPVIYKRFNRKKWLDPILTLFRPSRGWRAWQAGQHLTSRAVPTPQNLLYLRTTKRGRRWLPHHFWAHETYVMTVKVDPSITLSDYALQLLPSLDAPARRLAIRRMTRSLARTVRVLHDRSLSHRDLKAANLLVEGDPLAAEPRLAFIDLVGVKLHHPLPRRWQLQNLARLSLSLESVPGRTRTDTLRFLKAYLPWSSTRRESWKTIWREVAALQQRKRLRNLRIGRPIS